MTGFGAATDSSTGTTVSVEIRAVNARHLKLGFRFPPGGERWEPPLRELVSGALRRGSVDVAIAVRGAPDAAGASESAGYRVDEARAAGYIASFRQLKERYDLPGEVDLELLARCERLIVEAGTDPLELVGVEDVANTVARAVDELVEMRRREGERLAADLAARLDALAVGLTAVEERAPSRLTAELDRLRESVRQLLGEVAVDEDRLAREIAILADRWDISEEIVRARAHLEAFRDLLDGPEEEPVGKRLGFLSQELLREVNTLGAKANDATISRHVVEMKNELESLREQIENVE